MGIAANATLSSLVTPAPEDDQTQDEESGLSESLRSAIESTFAATADSAGETRERASELLDDVARRGRGAREEVLRRGQDARDDLARRSQEARQGVVRRGQDASADLVQRLEGELRSISERLAKLEAALRREDT